MTSAAVEMLNALLKGDLDTIDSHAGELDQAGGVDWLNLLATAFATMVHRRFSADTDVREITKFISGIRARYDNEGNRALPPLVGEALIRGALGETELMVDIEQEAAVSAQLILLYAMCEELPEGERDAVATAAVTIAERNIA